MMSSEIPVIDRADAAARSAHEQIRATGSRFFDELSSGERTLGFAAAIVAAEPLLIALRQIVAMETPGANATVKRMAAIARASLNTSSQEKGE